MLQSEWREPLRKYCLQAPQLMQCMTPVGILVLAPDSRGATWDDLPAAQGSFGPDIAFINAALAQTFALYNVDAAKLGIQGFSDGATYALGLGGTLTVWPCLFMLQRTQSPLVSVLEKKRTCIIAACCSPGHDLRKVMGSHLSRQCSK